MDERYKFFKEIKSIQTVNEVEVNLKQWLYKDGDPCEWNTGGWIKCGMGGKVTNWPTNDTGRPGTTSGSHSESVEFTASAIQFNTRLYAAPLYWISWDKYDRFSRSDVESYAYAGTQKELSTTLKKYSKLYVESSNPIATAALRYGGLNDQSTVPSTPTVLISGNAFPLVFSTEDIPASVVVGYQYSYKGAFGSSSNPGTTNIENHDTISKIYLT